MPKKIIKIVLYVLLLFLVVSTTQAQQKPANTTAYQPMVIGIVDLSAVIAFHPYMRNFDYHAQKFLRPWDGKRFLTGKEAWEASKPMIMKIKSIEAKIEKQVQAVNQALNDFAEKKISQSDKEKALDNLKELNKQKVKMLAELTRKTIGMFPENGYSGSDEKTGNYVMQEIRRAVYDVALRNNVAFVFNSSQDSFSGSETVDKPASSKELPQTTLDRFNISSLDDLQHLLFETSKNPIAPFGKPHSRMDFTKGACGEHFAQIRDPEHLQTLMQEYYENRNIFSNALKKFGSQSFLLHGRTAISEKNLTSEVLQYIFELHKTRSVERESAFKALR